MTNVDDPFSFLQMPTVTDRVNETFARLQLDPAKMPTLHRLLERGCECNWPMNAQTRATFDNICDAKLKAFQKSAGFALDHTLPYAGKRGDVSEAFLCAVAKPLIHSSHGLLGSMFRDGDTPNMTVIGDGNALMMLAESTQNDTPVLKRDTLESLLPEARLLVETQAVFTCYETVVAAQNTANLGLGQREMSMLLSRLQWYIPAMSATRSSLGCVFRDMANTAALNEWRCTPADAAPAESRVVALRRPVARQKDASGTHPV